MHISWGLGWYNLRNTNSYILQRPRSRLNGPPIKLSLSCITSLFLRKLVKKCYNLKNICRITSVLYSIRFYTIVRWTLSSLRSQFTSIVKVCLSHRGFAPPTVLCALRCTYIVELGAGNADDFKLAVEGRPQCIEVGILAGQPSVGGHVDQKHHAPGILTQRHVLAPIQRLQAKYSTMGQQVTFEIQKLVRRTPYRRRSGSRPQAAGYTMSQQVTFEIQNLVRRILSTPYSRSSGSCPVAAGYSIQWVSKLHLKSKILQGAYSKSW